MSTTTTTAAAGTKKPSLFDLSKKVAPKKEASKEKDNVTIPEVKDQLTRLKQARAEAKSLEAEIKMLEGEVKPALHEKFMELYQQEKKRPESFKVNDTMLVIVQDKYIKVDEGKAELLSKLDGILEKTRTYTFNEALVEKYEEQIAEAIMGLDIPDEDKASLLMVEDVTTIKKGTIDRLLQYPDPVGLYGLIQPILMLK